MDQYTYTYDAGDNMVSKAVYDAGTSTTDTTTYTCNDANEMTALVNGGTTVSYGYDPIGRVTSKSDGTYTATYGYGPAGMLSTVTSDFPDEGNVSYTTGANGRRRQRTDSSGTTQYKWHGWSVLHEEDGSGTLQRTYVGHTLAHVDGTNPALGAYKYYYHDHLGSTRRLRAQDKTSIAKYEYTPYGEIYASSGTTSATTHTYAMLAWDDAAQMYFAPFRYYMPEAGRWVERDPLGMVDGPNTYFYSGDAPTIFTDPMGLDIVRCPSFSSLMDDFGSFLGDYFAAAPGVYADAAVHTGETALVVATDPYVLATASVAFGIASVGASTPAQAVGYGVLGATADFTAAYTQRDPSQAAPTMIGLSTAATTGKCAAGGKVSLGLSVLNWFRSLFGE
ncbi:MAG: hypothetical protein GY851_14415 [bacterium]|nr:hypothetical protein [bacterium]